MGLLDGVIGGIFGGRGGTSSTLVKALLLMLAAKAVSSQFGQSASAAPVGGSATPGPAPTPSGKIESGILAGLPSLESMLDHFKRGNIESKVDSWIGSGPNKAIAPQEVKAALGEDAIAQLERETGLSREELLRQLSTALPQAVDKLTPGGRLPG